MRNGFFNYTLFFLLLPFSPCLAAAGPTTIIDTASTVQLTFSDSSHTVNVTSSGSIIISGASDGAILATGSNALINNLGTLAVGSGDALSFGGSATVSNGGVISGDIITTADSTLYITNLSSGTITGNISPTVNSTVHVTNSGTITGNITLGDNSSSLVTLNESSSMTGNITMNNSEQSININGGTISGKINGAGTINVTTGSSSYTLNSAIGQEQQVTSLNINNNSSSFLEIAHSISVATTTVEENSAFKLDENQNITGNVVMDNSSRILMRNGSSIIGNITGSSSGIGYIIFGLLGAPSPETIVTNGNIGSRDFALSAITIHNNNTLNISTNNNSITLTGSLSLGSGSELKVGNATVSATIDSFIPFNATSSNIGTVTFEDNNIVGGNLGTGNHSLHNVAVSASKTVDAKNYEINALNVAIGSAAILKSSSAISGGNVLSAPVGTSVTMDNGSTLELKDGSSLFGNVRGTSAGYGAVTAAGDVSISNIGDDAAINSVTTAAESNVTFGGDITTTGDTTFNGNAIFSNETTTITAHSLILNSGSSLSLTITDPSATSLEVVGAAIISANTTLYLTISGTISSDASIVLVNASETSSIGTIANSNIIINAGNNIYNGHAYKTVVEGNKLLITAVVSTVSFTNPVEQNTYDVITGSTAPSGELDTVKTYLENNTYNSDQKTEVLKSVTPQVDNSSNRVAFNQASIASNIISARLESLRNTGVSVSDLNSSSSKGGVTISDLDPSFTNNFFNKPAMAAQTLEPLRDNNLRPSYPLSSTLNNKTVDGANGSVWIQTFGSTVNQGNSSVTDGFTANSGGVAVGLDCQKCAKFTIGASASYAQSSINAKNSSKHIGIDTYQFSLYSAHNSRSYFVNTTLGFTLNNYASSRYVAVTDSKAKGNYSGQGYNARIEIGTRHVFESGLLFTPSLMITAAQNNINSYDEKGAGTLNLHVKNDSINFLEGRAGAELSKFFTSNKGTKFRPQIFASYGYDFIGDQQKTTSNFVGQTSSFASSGAKVAQGSLMAGTGFALYTLNNVTVSLNYGFEHRNNYNSNSGWFRVRSVF